MKKIALLGSTGSIGTQTLDVVRFNRDKLKIHSLVAFSDEQTLCKQAKEFAPDYTALISRDGEECLLSAVEGCDVAVVATRSITALNCICHCLEQGINVALANKEALVCGGELIMPLVGNAEIVPIDSEHCAVAKCLQRRPKEKIDKIILTASGGPFWEMPFEQLKNVTCEQALHHPNWHMGSKITIDSATMMNKSLEVIEASFLFSVPAENIEISVHRQSVVHSMVQFVNGEIMAQLAAPDMRLPIQSALLGDDGNFFNKTDLTLRSLTFEKPDFERFPCAHLGYDIFQYPVLCRTVMNAANDVCVERFLRGKFCFDAFYNIIMKAVDFFANDAAAAEMSVENIRRFDAKTREYVERLLTE